jgi:hypothetical protein
MKTFQPTEIQINHRDPFEFDWDDYDYWDDYWDDEIFPPYSSQLARDYRDEEYNAD